MEYNGDGTWNAGYKCPYIEVLNAQLQVAETSGKWSFKPTDMAAANGFGFVMDGAVGALLANFVQQTPNSEKYIPWRFFDSVTYQKKSSSFKMVVCAVRNDQGVKATLRFNLPWAMVGNYVSTSQVNDLVAEFIKFGDAQKNKIQASKAVVYAEFGVLQQATRAQATASTNEQELTKQINLNIQKNQRLLNEKRAAIKALDAQIAAAHPIIEGLQAQEKNLADAMGAEQQQMENNDKLLDDAQRADMFKNIDATITKETNDVIADLTKLKTQAANYNFASVTAAAQAGNVAQISSLLLGVQPLV